MNNFYFVTYLLKGILEVLLTPADEHMGVTLKINAAPSLSEEEEI